MICTVTAFFKTFFIVSKWQRACDNLWSCDLLFAVVFSKPLF